MKHYRNETVEARVLPVEGEYLRTRYQMCDNEVTRITVGMGEDWTVLACKEVYGKAVKCALELGCESCAFDLTPAAQLGKEGIFAAVEGVYGGAYRQKFTLEDRCVPAIACYAEGSGWTDEDLNRASALARSILQVRNLVNRPANLLTPEMFGTALTNMAQQLPVSVQVYHRDELAERGLNALLSVGDSSGNAPCMIVMRYNGAPDSDTRLGYVGKGVTCDTGGYCLKSRQSMAGMKGDMAGGAAVAGALCALAANGVKVNVTAVIPACENRISPSSSLPGDLVTSFSGKTIEVLNTDAEGRLLLCDAVTWAIREENATHLVDAATLTGAIYAMLGHVATGVMTNDDAWFARLEDASRQSGERFWKIPAYPEYERLIESDYADLRNTTKDDCGAIAAGLFIKHFTEDRPWMHLDIAGTADVNSPVWQHQVSGATGAAASTLYYLAAGMEG
ncbi:MAG: leucyl aminopeptidase family protein [Oscillospiraceae bacterium]|nr:leucyl aminopeptidase family protein [Oscillospiraceae bacterium]